MSRSPDLESLIDAHATHVWRVLRRFGVPESDVADVAQEVFLVVHRRLADFEGRSRMRTWLYGICRRCAAAHRRRAHRRHEVPVASLPERSDAPPQDRALDGRRALAWLDEVLGGLPDQQREVYVLYELEELTMAEVAAAMGCPLQTAYSRLYAARRAVRQAIEARGRSVA